MHTTTKLLLPAAARDRRSGFEALHRRASRQLLLWAALHVAPPLRRWLPLDDFVQEVWARAFAAFGSFDRTAGTFRGWLLGIAANVLREQLRSVRVRGPATTADAPERTVLDPHTSVVTRVARDEARDALLAVVDVLDERDRRLVVWRGLEELPFEEVGKRLGITANAAESRWRRLAERLHGRLPADLFA